jgi:hypothetical protein
VARPKIENLVRRAVQDYLVVAEKLSPEESPLNTISVARRLGIDRKTLKKYGLDLVIAKAAERQARNGKGSPRELERRSHADMLRGRDQEIDLMRKRCEALIAKVCLAEGNAQRLGIDPDELWLALPVPPRTLPHTGRKGR